jgi:hypothetical protein
LQNEFDLELSIRKLFKEWYVDTILGWQAFLITWQGLAIGEQTHFNKSAIIDAGIQCYVNLW